MTNTDWTTDAPEAIGTALADKHLRIIEEAVTMTDRLTKRELLARLEDLIMECEPETPEEVDEYLRDAGYDPDELVARMRQRIDALIAKRKQELEADDARKSG